MFINTASSYATTGQGNSLDTNVQLFQHLVRFHRHINATTDEFAWVLGENVYFRLKILADRNYKVPFLFLLILKRNSRRNGHSFDNIRAL